MTTAEGAPAVGQPQLVEALSEALSYAEYLAGDNWNCEVLANARAELAKLTGGAP